MRFIPFESARLFLDKTGEFLEQNEAANNLILGLSSMLLQKETRGGLNSDNLFCSVEDLNGRPLLAILLNNKNLIIHGADSGYEDAVKLAATEIFRLGRQVPGVVGRTEIAERFALEWASLSQLQAYVRMRQKIYMLRQVKTTQISPGKLRAADRHDISLISEWLYDFTHSINEPITWDESFKRAQEFIDGSTLFLWEDQVPVCMAKKARATRNGIVIGYVYTPPQYRNKGYATSCVASLSQLLLDEGKSFCALYTDLANPTSNHIYSNIGYEPVQHSIMYRFN